MKDISLLIGWLVCLTACSSEYSSSRSGLPYETWHIGLAAPKHMEIWVERVDVVNQRGDLYFDVFGGIPSYTGTAEGWHSGGGKTMPINNVDLPKQISLHWQSLVEPETYRVNIIVPQWVRNEMIKPEKALCAFDKEETTYYRNVISLGMAPGGIVKVWVGTGCLGHMEVGRYQAEVDPRGPYGGKSNGKYIPIEPENKAYVEKHGIPYGTW